MFDRRLLWGLFAAALALPPAACLAGSFAWAFHLLGDPAMCRGMLYVAGLTAGLWLLSLVGLVLIQTAENLLGPGRQE